MLKLSVIRKGEDWGNHVPLRVGSPVVESNHDLHRYLRDARAAEQLLPLSPIGLLGGDLCKTVGGTGRRDRLTSAEAITLPCDLVVARLDDTVWWFGSHLVARSTWLTGRLTMAMNAAWRGTWNVAPRAHPGDGRIDVLTTDMSGRERIKGWRRIEHGDHVPHPAINVARVKHFSEHHGGRPRHVEVDGVSIGRVEQIELRVLAGALIVVV